MFGEPVAVIAQAIGQARQIQRVAKRIPRGVSGGDGRLIQNAQAKCHNYWMPSQLQAAHRNGALEAQVRVASGCARASLVGAGKAQGVALAMEADIEWLVIGIAKHGGSQVTILSV